MKVDVWRKAAFFDGEDVVLLVVGNEHRARRVDADRAGYAPRGQVKSLLRLRGSGSELPDRTGLAEIDHIEVAIGIDCRSFNTCGVLARRRHLAALEQLWL